ncbi:FUSC family protein [Streptomyces sp. NPDC086023]|uniref:FUSC family protein n=1 Tax=Streptomyces sp. NPDC086023 TaxID=3365746 RepID=UPI0037CCFE0A
MRIPPGRRGRLHLFAPVPGSRPAAVGGLVNGVAVGLPLLAGIAAGNPAAGAWACLGGYVAAFTNKGGPRGPRTRGLVTAAVVNAAAFAAGELVTELFPVALLLLAVLVLLASLGDAVHPTVGRLGTMPTTALVTGAGGASAGLADSGRTALLVLCGGLWYAVATALLTPAPRLRGVLAVLAEPYRETGRHLARIAHGAAGTPDDYARTAAALTRAGAVVSSLRGQGGDEHLAALLAPLVDRATDLADLTAAVHVTGAPPPATARAFTATATALADRIGRLAALLAHRPGGTPTGPDPRQALADLDRACDALRARGAAGREPYPVLALAGRQRRLLARISDAVEHAHALAAGLPVPPGTRARPAPGPRPGFDRARLRAALAPGSAVLRHALRVTAVACAVFALVQACGLPHGEWATLAVLRVLRPRYADTLERAGQRIIGNLVGGACAALLIAWVSEPVALAAVLFVALTLGFALRPVNYAFWVLFGTPLVLIIGDVSDPGDWRTALARIGMTLLGSAAALLGGYLLWPTWEQGRLAARTAAATAAAAAYLDAVLRRLVPPPTSPAGDPAGRAARSSTRVPDTAPEAASDPDRARTAAERALAEARDAERSVRREPGHDPAAADRAATATATLYTLTERLGALTAHPPPAVERIPALTAYAAHAVPALTAVTEQERRTETAALADALEEMHLYLEGLHARRQRELAAGRAAEETDTRAAIRADEPVIELLAAIARTIGQPAPPGS